jgi:hypothetical protein
MTPLSSLGTGFGLGLGLTLLGLGPMSWLHIHRFWFDLIQGILESFRILSVRTPLKTITKVVFLC